MEEINNQDVLQFYAFSKDAIAGEGVGDKVEDPKKYKELNKIKNWRRMFSSFWEKDPFTYNGKKYLSFEHAFQSEKYRVCGYKELADKFTLESKDDISLLVGKDVKKAGRLLKLNSSEIELWEEKTREIKNKIYRCKFTKESNPGKALIATGNAQLINAGPRIKKIRCTRLENLREELMK